MTGLAQHPITNTVDIEKENQIERWHKFLADFPKCGLVIATKGLANTNLMEQIFQGTTAVGVGRCFSPAMARGTSYLYNNVAGLSINDDNEEFGDDDQEVEDYDRTREGSGDNVNIDSDYVGIDVNASSAAQSVSPPKTVRKQVKGGTSTKRKSEGIIDNYDEKRRKASIDTVIELLEKSLANKPTDRFSKVVHTLNRMGVYGSRGQEYYVRAVKYFETEEYANMFLALEGDEHRIGDENIRHACMILALQELRDLVEDNLDSTTIPPTRQPRRERGESGAEFIHSLLTETPTECQIQLRLDRNMFIQLVNLMIEKDLLHDAKYVKVPEQYYNEVLKALVILSFDIIRPHHDLSVVPPEVANGTRYWSYFKDAIGALDELLSMPLIYTFINVGWEGSVHDTTVWKDNLGDPNYNFPHPPPGAADSTMYAQWRKDSMDIVRHHITLRIWRTNRSESGNEGDNNHDQSNNEDDENANHMEVDG
uniref:DUF8040 domain-containing protein n=1 Tax=Chenopodium quinoa TaxID=63459 RepID=A0A803MY93_CHEQI